MNDRVFPTHTWEQYGPKFVDALQGLSRDQLEVLRLVTGTELGDRWQYEDEEHHKRTEFIAPLWTRLRELLAAERERDAMRDALNVLHMRGR